MRQTCTFPLRINSEPICTTFSVQSVSVHLSHLVHFLSINKCHWLSEFQNASACAAVILAESELKRPVRRHPSSTPCIQAKIFSGGCSNWALSLPLTPRSVCCPEAFAQHKPPHFLGWISRPRLPILFLSIPELLQTVWGDPSEPTVLYLLPDVFMSVQILGLFPLSLFHTCSSQWNGVTASNASEERE